MPTFLLHLTQAFRRLLQRPGFTLAAVLTLALGIGANTATFSLMDRLLLSSFPYREPNRIVTLFEWDAAKGEQGRFILSAPNFQDVRQRSTQFEPITGIRPMTANLSGFGEPVQVEVARVSAKFFPMLGLLGGYGLGHAITSQLYGITPGDPTTYLIVSPSLAFVALLSTLIPARRAATVNPVVALRDE